MAVQFSSYSGGPHGGSPVVLPKQEHWTGDLGQGLQALGEIPQQVAGMQFKKGLYDLFLKALNTPTSIQQTVPGGQTLNQVPEQIDMNNPPVGFSALQPGSMGDVMTQEPSRTVRAINPEYQDIARKLEILGYYRPYRSGEGSKRYETPEEEARRAGLRETAIQSAKAPERELAREQAKELGAATRGSREQIAEENRISRERQAEENREVQRERIEVSKANADLANQTRTIMAETARERAETARMEAIAKGEKATADHIDRLQKRLESVQNQIKTPPATTGGAKREWNYNDPKDQTTIRQYIQQENTIMDQLEKLGLEFPERRRLIEEEKNFIQSFISRAVGAPTTRGKIEALPSRGARPPAPTGATPPSRFGGPPSAYPDPRTNVPSSPTGETPQQRRDRLLSGR